MKPGPRTYRWTDGKGVVHVEALPSSGEYKTIKSATVRLAPARCLYTGSRAH
jgi:hypothetical protein